MTESMLTIYNTFASTVHVHSGSSRNAADVQCCVPSHSRGKAFPFPAEGIRLEIGGVCTALSLQDIQHNGCVSLEQHGTTEPATSSVPLSAAHSRTDDAQFCHNHRPTPIAIEWTLFTDGVDLFIGHQMGVNWMEGIKGILSPRSLCDVVMPGTHDSGTYAITKESRIAPNQDISDRLNGVPFVGRIVSGWAKTQGGTVAEQLAAGVRYLDLRISEHNAEHLLVHTMLSVPVGVVLREVLHFVLSHPLEVVVLDFNHLYNMTGHDVLIERIVSTFGARLAVGLHPTSTMQEFWDAGVQVVVLYAAGDVHLQGRLWGQKCIESFWPNTTCVTTLKSLLKAHPLSQRAPGVLSVGASSADTNDINGRKGVGPFRALSCHTAWACVGCDASAVGVGGSVQQGCHAGGQHSAV